MQRKERRRIRFLIVIGIIGFILGTGASAFTQLSAAAKLSIPAKITGNNVYVRKTAGRMGNKLLYDNKEVKLSKNQAVTIKGQADSGKERWYQITFKVNAKTLSGYMLSDYIKITLKAPVKAKITSSASQKISTVAGKNLFIRLKNKEIVLNKGKTVRILKEVQVGNQKWFYVSFSYGNKTYKGFLKAAVLQFTGIEAESAKPAKTPAVTVTPKPVKTPAVTATPKPVKTPAVTATPKPVKTPAVTVTPKPVKTSAVPVTTLPVQKTEDARIGKTGVVTAAALNVRLGAGTSYSNLTHNSQKVQITQGTSVTILDTELVNTTTWYKVSFCYKEVTLYGYVSGTYILIGGKPSPSPSVTPATKQDPKPTASTSVSADTPMTDAQFEAALTKEGFPASYKNGLRQLHKRYPLWQFKAFKTGYSFEQAVAKENVLGKNLITKSKASGWKSYEKGAYNYATDAFIPFDGSTWVTASKAALEYYMDPRNFLTTDGIFQFEYLGYEPEYQKRDGIESILKNTVLYNSSYTYKDSSGEERKTTYGKTFVAAAQYSQVNPFHLATRVKQEVVISKGLSSSATGNFSGYQGYYNFYNIGAYHSTAANGAIINGLKFAKTGNNMSEANKDMFLIPWNSPYNAIVGGAKYIGSNYIIRGQNTVYLQKFNLSSYSTFSHQYMANVEAAKSEAQKTYTAYQNFTDIPVVFQIPVYNDMPAKNASIPDNVKNPNNWLKTLSVTGASLTPTFKVTNSEDTSYTVMVGKNTENVRINATSVSPLARVDGTGTVALKDGMNTVKITVTAENGKVRTYVVYVIRS